MLFPVDMREWLPKNHLVHFVVDAVGVLSIQSFKINNSGSGDEQYPPAMMLALLVYCRTCVASPPRPGCSVRGG
jgi:transposase